MAQAIVQDRRPVKALGILTRHEVEPIDDRPGFFHVTDTATGSGKQYLTSATSSSCPDRTFRNHECKHMQAAMRETAALEAYAARWDALAGPWCPRCGTALETRQYWVGGRGWQFVEVCANEVTHGNR